MELGFSGKTRVSSKQWENIYLLRDITWNVLFTLFGSSEEEMRVTEWHNMEDTSIVSPQRNNRKYQKQLKNKWRHIHELVPKGQQSLTTNNSDSSKLCVFESFTIEQLWRMKYNEIIQGVHKVSLQFQKFITKANERTDKWKLLDVYIQVFSALFNVPLYGHH